LLLRLIETDVFQKPQLHKHFNVVRNFMRYLIVPFVTALTLTSCATSNLDTRSKKEMKDWKRCGKSTYAVGIDTLHLTQVHLVVCDNHFFNVQLLPTKGVKGENKFYSGSYSASGDTLYLQFNTEHAPVLLSNRIAYSTDKNSFFWFSSETAKSLTLRIYRPKT
jgi:hypothetical protein